jgi:hypothetical protein
MPKIGKLSRKWRISTPVGGKMRPELAISTLNKIAFRRLCPVKKVLRSNLQENPMKTPCRLLAVLLLSLAFNLTALAGDMDTPKAPPAPIVVNEPPPTEPTEEKPEVDVIIDAALGLLQTMLSIF